MCFFLITNAPLGQCQVEEAPTQPRSQGGVRQDRQDLVVQRRELLPHLPGYLLVTSSTLTLHSSFCPALHFQLVRIHLVRLFDLLYCLILQRRKSNRSMNCLDYYPARI